MLRIIIVMTCPSAHTALEALWTKIIAMRKEFCRNPQYVQTDRFFDPDVLQRWGGLSPANRRSCSNRSNNHPHTVCVAIQNYPTIVIAAAATAVLTDDPGTMLLSDVLTSTATTMRLPTGSTFWGQNERLNVS